MDWIEVQAKLPDVNKPVNVMGVLTTQASWNAEKQSWEIVENGKIHCEVTQWKEIENGICPEVNTA